MGPGLLVLVRRKRTPRFVPVTAVGETVKPRFWVAFVVPVEMATFVAICSPLSVRMPLLL
jgi:hypothetical protein